MGPFRTNQIIVEFERRKIDTRQFCSNDGRTSHVGRTDITRGTWINFNVALCSRTLEKFSIHFPTVNCPDLSVLRAVSKDNQIIVLYLKLLSF